MHIVLISTMSYFNATYFLASQNHCFICNVKGFVLNKIHKYYAQRANQKACQKWGNAAEIKDDFVVKCIYFSLKTIKGILFV